MLTAREIINQLKEWQKAYDEGHPIVSDEEYDKLYFELKELEADTKIIYPDSPTQSVQFETVSALKKVTHNHTMASLDKTKDIEELRKFWHDHRTIGMAKLDGLSLSALYQDGKLVRVETRGNGVEGEDVTHNAAAISNLPKEIPYKDEMVVDGEVICTWKDFVKYGFDSSYKNPRNFASGSVRLLSGSESCSRHLTFVAWDMIKGYSNLGFLSLRLRQLEDLGFTVVPYCLDSNETLEWEIDFLKEISKDLSYPIDGLVFKEDDCAKYESLGSTAHHPRGALAFKFYDEEVESTLQDITWQLGRTGVLSPVAIFDPVDLDGSTISRASLHNLSVAIDTLGKPFVGQKISVYKANAIIPQISWAQKEIDPDNPIPIITHCPICGEKVKVKNNEGIKTLWCPNPTCPGQLQTRIEYFFSKRGLDAKGLAGSTIGKILDWGWAERAIDFFSLSTYRSEWIKKDGFGQASVDKILNAIETCRTTTLDKFISGIGIPLVGKTVAENIADICDYSWDEFRINRESDWTTFDGFGTEMNYAINHFDYSEADEIAKLLIFKEPEQTNLNTKHSVQDITFCVTGKLGIYKNRQELVDDVENHGGKVVSSVTSKTNYLVTNTPNSGTKKNQDAQQLGIPIITEEQLRNMLES